MAESGESVTSTAPTKHDAGFSFYIERNVQNSKLRFFACFFFFLSLFFWSTRDGLCVIDTDSDGVHAGRPADYGQSFAVNKT